MDFSYAPRQQELEAAARSLYAVIEELADLRDGVELIIGVRRDPRFGPVAVVDVGGVHAEAPRRSSASSWRASSASAVWAVLNLPAARHA